MPDRTVLYVLAGIVGVFVFLGLILWGVILVLLRKLRKHEQELRELEAQEHPPPAPPPPPTPEEQAVARAAAARIRETNRERIEDIRRRARESGQRYTVTRTTTTLGSGFEGLARGLREMGLTMDGSMRASFTSVEQAMANLRSAAAVSIEDDFGEIMEIMGRMDRLTARDLTVLQRHFPRLNFGNVPQVAVPDPKVELARRATPPKQNPTWHEHLLRDEDEEPECPPTTTTSQPTREKPPPTPIPSDGKKITS